MKQVNLRIFKTILPLLLGLFLSMGAYAQSITVKGQVKDTKGEPIIGANIIVKGNASNGTITDIDGNFTMKATKNAVLVVSFIGYKSVEVVAAPTMNVTLQDDTQVLGDVVVIGYGTVKKSDATGSVVSIKADQLNKGMITTPADMLQGKTPGVQITNNGGAPGSGSTIRIRGGSSLKASNDPLIVIDGLPISSTGISGMSDVLSTINPNDIESFSVLKDASATAIYGSRASNGVIVITTKKGTSGKPSINLDMTGSLSYISKKVDVMNASELKSFLNTYLNAHTNIDPTAAKAALGSSDTDWQDQIYRTALTEDINASVSGGMPGKGFINAMPYRLSIGYLNDNGVLKTSNMKRSTLAVNLSPQFLDKRLTLNLNGKGIYAKNRFADQGAISQAVGYDPTQSVYNDTDAKGIHGYTAWKTVDSKGVYSPNTMATENPLALLEEKNDKSIVKRFVGNAQFDYKFMYLPGLRANLNLGLDFSTSDGTVDTPVGSEMSWHDKAQNGSGLHTDYGQTRRDQSLEYYMNYVKECNEIASKFDFMAGYSWQHFFNSTNSKSVKQNDRNSILSNSFNKTESYLVSFYGRFNYTLMDRYLLTVTLRDDGTSRFQNNKWGLFPSAALAWRISEEPIMKKINWLSNLKLRLGYGVTGQQDLNAGDYPSIPTYHTNQMGSYYMFGNSTVIPITPNAYDSKLKWESTATYNIGLDYGFFNDRINGSIDYYIRKTKDLINKVPISAGTNLSNYVTMNVGDLKNTGLEFALNVVPVQTKDWNWDFGFNLSWNKNKITKLTASDSADYPGVPTGGISGAAGNNIQIHKVGYAVSSFYVYQQVYDTKGNPIEDAYVDRNGDGKINDKDMYVCKKPAPDVFLGFNTTLSYKQWTLSAAARSNIGNYMYYNVASNYEMQADMWTNNFVSNRLRSAVHSNFSQAQYFSDYYIKNASFFKLDKVTLAYQINKWARVYATAQNVCTITKYKGLDPEISGGIDNNMYPRPKTFLLGASFNF
jgi:TonB-linked SusC/RagA family outer membrane protein